MADRTGWLDAVESDLRAIGRELEVPPARDLTVAMLQRLDGRAVRRRCLPGLRTGAHRRRPGRHAVLVVVAAFLAVLIATPQGRPAISHVFRFAGVELRQGPGPAPSPVSTPSLPGEQPMTLEQARRQVSFPIMIPAALGRPAEVVVSDGGRAVSMIYRRTPYGLADPSAVMRAARLSLRRT